jgi:hypothetical protein
MRPAPWSVNERGERITLAAVDRRRLVALVVGLVVVLAMAYGLAWYQLANSTVIKNCGVHTYYQQPAPGCT